MADIDNPVEGATPNTETQDTPAKVEQTLAPAEVDVDKEENLQKIREFAKGLKKDLDTYKPAQEVITSVFGDAENAKVAGSVYSEFAGEEFDPERFFKVLEQLSPTRSKALIDKFATSQAKELSTKEVEKLFGGTVSPEEIANFRKWKDSNFGLGTGDDIPEALKFNADGTPKTEEEVKFLQDLQRQAKQTRDIQETENRLKIEREEADKRRDTETRINTFANDRLKVLDSELKNYGLAPSDKDTAEQRQAKDTIKQLVVAGVSQLFLANPEAASDYNAALGHLAQGETLLARRYEPRIEVKLLEIMRSKPVTMLLESFAKASTQQNSEPRPEISKAGGSSADQGNKTGQPVTGNDIVKKLVESGQLTL